MSEIPTSSGIPPEVPSAPPPQRKLFGKKLYLIIGLIAVITVVSALTIMYFLPRGLGAKISLGMNYSVGEKMTYDVTITISAMGQTITQQGTIKNEILSFDGVNYTIRQTVRVESQEFSYTFRMNKTGHILDFSSLPPELQQTYSSIMGIPGFGSYFPRNEARVGEGWQIPINIHEGQYSLNGTMYYGVSGVANITVPAGTYEVFKIDIVAANVIGTYQSSGTTVNMALSLSAYGYLENATCRPIEFNIQVAATASTTGQTVSMSIAIQIRLREHVR